MKRKLFHILGRGATIFSSLLLVAVVLLATVFRSHRPSIEISVGHYYSVWCVANGSVGVQFRDLTPFLANPALDAWWKSHRKWIGFESYPNWDGPSLRMEHEWMGFGYGEPQEQLNFRKADAAYKRKVQEATSRLHIDSPMSIADQVNVALADTIIRQIQLPLWVPALLFAILPAIWILALYRRSRRYAGGCCQHCGYDLRATPERCPECGMVPIVTS